MTTPASAARDTDVLIIGGGFAGITAAWELSRLAKRVVLLEARDRLGGRAWLKKDGLGGLPLEMGGAWIDPKETYSWAEAQRYGMVMSASGFRLRARSMF